ncbi:GNAT family N-acetyltransferase [Alteromonadaceae bacterium BrNp21-10]|nr:GNAT family N-acetyltransferase [Alteromonadaceae bacterium BrNp21-10]
MDIRIDDLTSEKIADLLQAHHQDMLRHSPPESVHALDIEKLKAHNITFWSAWQQEQLAGCGAIKDLGNNIAEIKSMRTAEDFLRQGVAAAILTVIIEHATQQGFHELYLETGSMDAFIPARRLYEHYGFDYCSAFADYVDDPYSLFMRKSLL